jgi:hypothetical protein
MPGQAALGWPSIALHAPLGRVSPLWTQASFSFFYVLLISIKVLIFVIFITHYGSMIKS